MNSRPDPFELVLLLADCLGEEEARLIVRDVRDALSHGDDAEPWLRAVLLARDVGALSDDATHYLLDVLSEEPAFRESERDVELRAAADAMDACKAAHGLTEDEEFLVDDAPEEWQVARRHWESRFERIRADWLRRLGEHRLADELLLRPDDFQAASHRGWREVIDDRDEPPDDAAGRASR
jgi:hypothetical protein